MNDQLYQIWFSLRCGVGNREFVPLLEQYGSPYEIFMAEEAEVERMSCSDSLKRALCDKSLAESIRIWEYCCREGVRILFWQDTAYPVSLRILQDPPVLLYSKGHLPDLSKRLCIGMVGTRKMSEYGKSMAYKIGYELAAAGAVVVSGLALGIDAIASAGALAARGSTVVVLGSGIDHIYPAEHTPLAKAVTERGAVLTEYPPGSPPIRSHFPVRNRIISALSQGVVVVEADAMSGALITARCAISQGREIYAVPGNVGENNTEGTNRLIRDGASVVLRARDVLENYAFLFRDSLDLEKLTSVEKRGVTCDDEYLSRLGIYARVAAPPLPTAGKSNRPADGVSGVRPRLSKTATQSESRGKTKPKGAPPPATPQAQAAKASVPQAPTTTGDRSGEVLAGLSDKQRRIFELLPLDHAVTLDQITREGFTVSEVLTAMTVLEIKGLTVCLPGGLFSRK